MVSAWDGWPAKSCSEKLGGVKKGGMEGMISLLERKGKDGGKEKQHSI